MQGVNVLMFMFINGLHVHVRLFEKLQTLKNWGKRLVHVTLLCFVTMTSDPTQQHKVR